MRPRGIRPLARALGRLLPRGLRSWLVSVGYLGAFPSTDPLNLDNQGWYPRNATADQTLVWNLTNLIAQARQLARENPTARGVLEGWKADVIGTGIGVDPDTGNEDLNAKIRPIWKAWCENATPEGNTLWELQSQAMGEWCEAGAHLWREITIPERVAQGLPPIVFTPLEVEWLTLYPIEKIADGCTYVRGVEMDQWGRPLRYHVMDYNLLNTLGIGVSYGGPGYVIPADKIIHGFEKRRPRQTHGEPILAIAITRLKQEEQLVSIELKAARNTAAVANVITSDWHDDNKDQYGTPIEQVPAGATVRLFPGEKIQTVQNNRPTTNLGPFIEVLKRNVAAALRSSLQWIDRDVGRASYANSRMDELLSARVRKPVQDTIARTVASAPYLRVLPWILLQLGVAIPADPAKREALFRHKLMPDRPKYVDPIKDELAAKKAIDDGLSTLQEECGAIGRDWKQVAEQREVETETQDAMLVRRIASISKAIATAQAKDPNLKLEWAQVLTAGGAQSAPGAYLDAIAAFDASNSKAAAGTPGDPNAPA